MLLALKGNNWNQERKFPISLRKRIYLSFQACGIYIYSFKEHLNIVQAVLNIIRIDLSGKSYW